MDNLLELILDGYLAINIKTKDCFLSSKFKKENLNYSEETLPNDKSLLSKILYNKDINKISKLLEHNNFNVKLRLVNSKKNIVWVKCKGILTENSIIMVSLMDITEYENKNKSSNIFLATVTHELRAPLNGIIGNSELLRYEKMEGEAKILVDSIDLCSRLLLTLINNVLDFSKLEAGKMSLHYQNFSIRTMINEILQLMKINSKDKKNLEIISYISTDVNDIVYGDSMRIGQILINIIGNAVKFTEKGYVKIQVLKGTSADRYIFQIEDTGIGIAKENISNLFKCYNQLDDSIAKDYGGTGLGLYISKLLSRLMNGDIKVESELGKGSKFTIELQIEKEKEEINASCEDLDNIRTNNKNILVVEDIIYNQIVMKKFLKKIGYECDIADNGLQAINKVQDSNDKFDIIFMDIHMPIKDGIEATRIIRHLGYKMKIIAMTANANEGDSKKYLKIFDDYISKPFTIQDIRNIIKKNL